MKTKVADPWGDVYEEEREEHRRHHGRLTYDCRQTRVREDRVVCAAGHRLHNESKDGSMYLVAVLRGRTASACMMCEQFEGGD